MNNSAAAGGGVVISGTNQQVGNIDGSGNTTIDAGASLVASRIQQTALVLGGTASQHALLTMAAADAAGNPLSGELSESGIEPLSGLAGGDTSAAQSAGTAGLSTGDSAPAPLAGASLLSSNSLGGAGQSVPEPSTLSLLVIAALAWLAGARGNAFSHRW